MPGFLELAEQEPPGLRRIKKQNRKAAAFRFFRATPHNGARRFGQCFDPSESMENAGILDVFPIFHAARLGQKIRRSPQLPLCGVALIIRTIHGAAWASGESGLQSVEYRVPVPECGDPRKAKLLFQNGIGIPNVVCQEFRPVGIGAYGTDLSAKIFVQPQNVSARLHIRKAIAPGRRTAKAACPLWNPLPTGRSPPLLETQSQRNLPSLWNPSSF